MDEMLMFMDELHIHEWHDKTNKVGDEVGVVHRLSLNPAWWGILRIRA